MNWAVFLDRDGVINEEVEYLSTPDQLKLIPGTAQAIKILNEREIPVIVVTNQAGIARGYFSELQLVSIHKTLRDILAGAGAYIDRFYYCPHHPIMGLGSYQANCNCRKPKPGMLLQAADDFKLDLALCYLIGDKASDIAAGKEVGCRTVLVQTGYGSQEWQNWSALTKPDHVAKELSAAVGWIFEQEDQTAANLM